MKWYRSTDYYSRPIKGSWEGEGGGALINQAIHQIDILLFLAGPVERVTGFWQLGTLHKIESEDLVNALMRFRSGAIGVIQASTAFWPGYPERLEIHGRTGLQSFREINLPIGTYCATTAWPQCLRLTKSVRAPQIRWQFRWLHWNVNCLTSAMHA